MRNLRSVCSIFILAIIIMAFQSGIAKSSAASKVMVVISIDTAYYADLDNDGSNGDIFSGVTLYFSGSSRFNLDYYITLTLPSGKAFIYGYHINTRLMELHLDNYFFNHGIESGYYNVKVEVISKTGGIAYTQSNIDFDPPGGEQRPPSFQLSAW